MNETLLISILAASITAGTPILFAALGELISERAGVTNLGVDGCWSVPVPGSLPLSRRAVF